ncbi:MAG: hypothetical protein LUC44_01310 [Prevotellaceae bacterium]|nr:hypothetical protein [Prevotellaceae bacterium]
MTTLTACSDDDNGNGNEIVIDVIDADAVKGTYQGYTSVESAYFTGYYYSDQSMTISKNQDTTYTLSYTNERWGTYTITLTSVTTTQGGYTFSGEGSGVMGDTTYACTASGTTDVDLRDYTITISSVQVMGGTTITLHPGTLDWGAMAAGSFEGYTTATFAYIDYNMGNEDATVEITDAGDSTVNVTLTSGTWGSYTVSGAAVSANGSIVIAETAGTGTLTGHSGVESTYNCTIGGTVSSIGASLTVSVPAMMGGTTITFTTGDITPAALVESDYTGLLDVSVSGIMSASSEVSLTVKLRADENGKTVSITIPEATVFDADAQSGIPFSMAFSEMTITGVPVTADADGYSLGETAIDVTDAGGVAWSGTLSDGKIDADGLLTLNYTCTPVTMAAMGLNIACVFTSAN